MKGGPDSSFPLEPVVCSDPLIRYPHHCLMESAVTQPGRQRKRKMRKIKVHPADLIHKPGWGRFMIRMFRIMVFIDFLNLIHESLGRPSK